MFGRLLLFLLLSALGVVHAQSEVKAVVFDFGGVVATVDRAKIVGFLTETLHVSAEELKPALQEWKRVLASGGDERAFWENYARSRRLALPENWFTALEQMDLFSEIPGTAAIVRSLHDLGYQTPLLSNVREHEARLIRKFNYYQAFDPLLLSYEMGVEKPEREAYQILLDRLQLPASAVIFIDDCQKNIEAAARVGIDAIYFSSAEKLVEELRVRGIEVCGSLNENLREELLEMARVDQEARAHWLEAPDRSRRDELVALDLGHLNRLEAIVEEYGWPGYALVGADGAHAAWLLTQHMPSLPFQQKCLRLLEEAVARRDASAIDMAYLSDRVSIHEGKAQTYGTQVEILDQRICVYTVTDRAHLDERRAAIGLCPMEEYQKQLAKMYKLAVE